MLSTRMGGSVMSWLWKSISWCSVVVAGAVGPNWAATLLSNKPGLSLKFLYNPRHYTVSLYLPFSALLLISQHCVGPHDQCLVRVPKAGSWPTVGSSSFRINRESCVLRQTFRTWVLQSLKTWSLRLRHIKVIRYKRVFFFLHHLPEKSHFWNDVLRMHHNIHQHNRKR